MMHRGALGPGIHLCTTQSVGMESVHTTTNALIGWPWGASPCREKKNRSACCRTLGTVEEAVAKDAAACGQRYGARAGNKTPHLTGLRRAAGRSAGWPTGSWTIVRCAYDPHSTRCCCCCLLLSACLRSLVLSYCIRLVTRADGLCLYAPRLVPILPVVQPHSLDR